MSFGLLNAEVLQPFFGVYVVVYFDDVLVYSKDQQSCIGHLRQVLADLQKEHLRLNMENEFS